MGSRGILNLRLDLNYRLPSIGIRVDEMTVKQRKSEAESCDQRCKVLVTGAGPMGCLLCAHLDSIADVTLVCRGAARRDRIAAGGCRTSGLLEAVGHPDLVSSIDELGSLASWDTIFVATKTTAIPSVAAMMGPLLPESAGVRPLVVSFQNGIDSGSHLIELLGWTSVARMTINLGAESEGDGAVSVSLSAPPHKIGVLSDDLKSECALVATMLTDAGLHTEFVDHVEPYVWGKGLLNAAANPVAALTNMTVGEIIESPANRVLDALMMEGIRVAEAEGVTLGEDYLAKGYAFLQAAGRHTPSMVHDIRSGRESEVGQLNRQIILRADRTGVDVPTHRAIDALIESFDWRVFRDAQELEGVTG